MRITLSRRGDYAVRAMLALAAHEALGSAGYLSARRVAERMRIPLAFSAHVLTDLVRAGLITAGAGRSGGYRLAAPAASISLLRVVDAAGGLDDPPRCVIRGSPCDAAGHCAVHETIDRTTTAARAELARTSLADLIGAPGS